MSNVIHPRVLVVVLGYMIRSHVMKRLYLQKTRVPYDVLTMMNDNNTSDKFENVTRKYQHARSLFLRLTEYTHMLTVEDDMLIPEHALNELLACNGDVAYGLYVWRYEGLHYWNTYPRFRQDGVLSLSHLPKEARRHFGQIVQVEGVGNGCTLFNRYAMEQCNFYHTEEYCGDTGFAFDAQKKGLRQAGHTGVVCGHLLDEERVIVPDIQQESLYRIDHIQQWL